ncbi:hypothetical protein ANAPH2_01382 [Anaplasma phagocytophilum]|nr:hypothetical protein ANAPH2_01382 [Anaplasma phagocytophilum]
MTDVDDVEGITSFKLSFSFGDSIKGAPIKLWNISLQYDPDSKTLVSMPITYESLCRCNKSIHSHSYY